MGLKEDAKEVLSEKDYASLMSLNEKARNFETTAEEEAELSKLIDKARNAIARREKTKQLSFLKNGDFTVAEVLSAMKATKKDINKAVSELFKGSASNSDSEVVGIFEIDGEKIEYRNDGRLNPKLSAALKANADREKFFVSGLTDFGRAYLTEGKPITVGQFSGKMGYKGITDTLKRFYKHDFDRAKLMKELGLPTKD